MKYKIVSCLIVLALLNNVNAETLIYNVEGRLDEVIFESGLEDYAGAEFRGNISYDTGKPSYGTDADITLYEGAQIDLILTDVSGRDYLIYVENATVGIADNYGTTEVDVVAIVNSSGSPSLPIVYTDIPIYDVEDPSLKIQLSFVHSDGSILASEQLDQNLPLSQFSQAHFMIYTLRPGSNALSKLLIGDVTSVEQASNPEPLYISLTPAYEARYIDYWINGSFDSSVVNPTSLSIRTFRQFEEVSVACYRMEYPGYKLLDGELDIRVMGYTSYSSLVEISAFTSGDGMNITHATAESVSVGGYNPMDPGLGDRTVQLDFSELNDIDLTDGFLCLRFESNVRNTNTQLKNKPILNLTLEEGSL